MPIRGGGSPGAIAACRSTAHPVSAAGSEPTTITSSPSVLITRASTGRECSTASTNRSTVPTASSSPRSTVRRAYPARSANAIATRSRPSSGGALGEIGLHVADHVLLDEVREEATVEVVHDRRREGQRLARQALHLLGDLHARHTLAHERLMDVQVEQAHLGVGDLRDRLPVHTLQLQERRQRKPGVEHRGGVLEHLQVFVGDRSTDSELRPMAA